MSARQRRNDLGAGIWLGIGVLLVLLMAGCATPGRVRVAEPWASKLTASEQAEVDVIELAVQRLCTIATKNGHTCRPPSVVIVRDSQGARYSPDYNSIYLPRRMLDPRWRAVTSHELSHWFFDDSRPPGCERVACELNANVHAIAILIHGFGYEKGRAVNEVRVMLTAAVIDNVKPSPGHPSACAELHDYQRRVYVPPVVMYPCEEKVAERKAR